MAKQRGFLNLEGTIGDITFLRTQDGFRARRKGGVSAARMATDPAYARQREHSVDFKSAAAAAKLLRSAFPALVAAAADRRLSSRLTPALLRVVQSDPVSARGQKKASAGNPALLEGFEFNVKASLNSIFMDPLAVTANPATGVADINVSGFSPLVSVSAPNAATHYQLVMGAAGLDFDTNLVTSATDSTGYKLLDNANTGSLGMNCTLTPASTSTMVVVFGIQFALLDNGVYYPLNNGAFNALQIVKVTS